MNARRWIIAAGVLAAIVLVAAGVSVAVRQRATAALETSSQEQLGLLGAGLRSTLDRYAPIPGLISDSVAVRALIDDPTSGDRVDAANRFLEKQAAAVGGIDAYVLRPDGRAIAASNWSTPWSFVGNDYSFRPYFREAITACRGAYYGIGVTTNKPGYFLATCIRGAAGIAGVAVVKVDLTPLEATWRKAGEQVAVVDGDGIIFLASDPAWRYRPLDPIDGGRLDRIRAEQRYAKERLDPPLLGRGSQAIHPDLPFAAPVDGTAWSIHTFVSTAAVRRQATLAFTLTLLGGLVLALTATVASMRHARLRTARLTRRQLEERVAERTGELRQARDALQAEIAERGRIDGDLHRVRRQLAQANRLAAVGQTFAGLGHEIAQPLTALRSQLDNCRLLGERGRAGDLAAAIDDMAQTVDRLVELAKDLKDRARQREQRREPVELAAEATRAVDLVRFRAADIGTAIRLQAHDPGAVVGDPVRLQMVAMNLVLNALDAVAGAPRKTIDVTIDRVDGMAERRVADSGPGLSAEQQAHLFEPFSTTRRQGLGLGLAISYGTVQDHGGTIAYAENQGGGAVFIVRLPPAGPPSGRGAGQ